MEGGAKQGKQGERQRLDRPGILLDGQGQTISAFQRMTRESNDNDNYMNALKSALKLSKNEPSNEVISELYEEVKSWDQARARLLQNYMQVVELALDALDSKVGHV